MRKRAECPSVLYKGRIYVFGGFGEHPEFEHVNEVYDPASDKWALIDSFPVGKAVTHQGVVVIDDKIWHIGGRAVNADGPVTSQVLIYNVVDNSWSNGPELKDPATGQPLPLGGGGAALLGRTLHVFGGFSPTICLDQNKYHLTLDIDKWLANPQTTAWENKLAPMPVGRNHLSTIVLNGKIYALGGQFGHDCDGTEQVYCHVYDAIADTWTRLTDLPSPRSHTEPGTFALDGQIYMVGGQGPSGAAQNTVLVFNPAANGGNGSWTYATQYQLPDIFFGISAKVTGNTFVISHGALSAITHERKETYTAPIVRNIPNQLGFATSCFNQTTIPNQKVTLNNILYTVEGQTEYNLTSNAAWLTITKNASGTVTPSAIGIQAAIDPAGLADGNYTATITAKSQGATPAFSSGTFCVNLNVTSAAATLTVTVNGNGTITKAPDQVSYTPGSTVSVSATPASGQQFTGWSGDVTGNANPIAVVMNSNKIITANFSQALISNIASTTGRSYILGELSAGNAVYSDRVYQATSVPPFLNHAALIKTANDDKANKSTSMLSFTLSKNATVYVAYDPRATVLPSWLSGWQKLSGTLGINDIKISYLNLYSKNFSPGKVSLGGSLASPAAGAQNNYVVMAVAQASQYTLTVITTGNGTVAKSPDLPSYQEGAIVSLTATPGPGQQFAGWSGGATGNANPLSLTISGNTNITAGFVPSSALIKNVSATTGRSYLVSNLVAGAALYTDRTYQATSVPALLNNTPYIRTPNDDKANKSASTLSFDLSQSATLYVAYDPRATALPSWLGTWQKQSIQLGLNDPKISYLTLYSKSYPAGKVTLGGNLASPAAGAQNNYIVAAIAQPSALAIQSSYSVATDALSLPYAGDILFSQYDFDKLKVYPNPLHNKFHIAFPPKYKGSTMLQLMDVTGREYDIGKYTAGSSGSGMEVDISRMGLKAGLYFLRLNFEGGDRQIVKLTIE